MRRRGWGSEGGGVGEEHGKSEGVADARERERRKAGGGRSGWRAGVQGWRGPRQGGGKS